MSTSRFAALKALAAGLVMLLGLAGTVTSASAAAIIAIINNDDPNEGFNDATPAAPVGGNTGTTLGQQRLNAFQHAAGIWGATLTSNVTIAVRANFDPLTCTATGAVLGSAGPISVSRDFTNAPLAGTWYHASLANKRAGFDLSAAQPEIGARFNSNLGQAGCLTGTFFYLGLDNNHGSNIDLVTVLLHEFAHGLGFSNVTNGSTGAPFIGFPSVWDHFLLDGSTNLQWVSMTDAQRAASAINPRKLAWTGANVTGAVPGVLSLGTPRLNISGPAAGPAVGDYLVGAAAFGAQLTALPVIGQLMPVTEQGAGTGAGCTPFNAANTLAANNNIALIGRGVCGFIVKVKNAQNAGARGVVIADNVAGSPPPDLGGADPTITIPSVRISQADGVALRARLTTRSRTASGVIANLGVNTSQYAGADLFGRALMYTPNPFQGGSSVSHWDTSAFPNQLMEPAINADLTHSLLPPADLTFKLLQDIGW